MSIVERLLQSGGRTFVAGPKCATSPGDFRQSHSDLIAGAMEKQEDKGRSRSSRPTSPTAWCPWRSPKTGLSAPASPVPCSTPRQFSRGVCLGYLASAAHCPLSGVKQTLL
jgi:hypothetical protein